MTERERVEEVRIFFKFNKKTFSEVLGYAYSQNYTSFLNGKSNISMKMIKGLKEYDPRINIDWILTGKGQMLLSNQDPSSTNQVTDGDENLVKLGEANSPYKTNIRTDLNNKEIEYLKKEIEHLKQRLEDKDKLISILEKNQK